MGIIVSHQPILDIDFMPIPDLESLVFDRIDQQAARTFRSPVIAAEKARRRKMIVTDALLDVADYPQDMRAILVGFYAHWRLDQI